MKNIKLLNLKDFIKTLIKEDKFIGYQLLIKYGLDDLDDEGEEEYYLSQADEQITKSKKEIKKHLYPFFKKLDSIELDENEFAYINFLLLDKKKDYVICDYYFQKNDINDEILKYLKRWNRK